METDKAPAAGKVTDTKAAAKAPAVDAVATAAAADIAKPARKAEQLQPIRMKPAEFARTVYVATAHANTIPEDLCKPEYWAHVASSLKPWDRLEVRADDGTWYAEGLVLEVGRGWSRCHLLKVENLSSIDVAQTQAIQLAGYEIQYRGEFSRWSVIRKSDRAVVREELGTQGSALDWVHERLKADR